MIRFFLTAALCGFALTALAVGDPRDERDPSALWSTWSGGGTVELRTEYFRTTDLEFRVDGRLVEGRVRVPLDIRNLGSISIYAPYGNFEDFDSGRLDLKTGIVLRYRGREVSLENLVATGFTNRDHPALRLSDGSGRHLLTLSHPHVLADRDDQLLTIHNADLQATQALAEALGFPELAGAPIGMAELDLNLHIPPDADVTGISPPNRGLSCAGRPNWPQDSTPGNLYEVDVQLIQIGQVAFQGSNGTEIKVAPSATLKSVSNSGDAVWIPKFNQRSYYTFQPRDQHPFLVWNMYRIADNRIEQLGASGVKHAFLTLNFNCAINCNGNIGTGGNSGNVLWPGCEDVYGTGTNDSNFNQGPRYDIVPSEGLFFSQGSFFDPGSTGNQTNNSGTYQNRLMVDPGELQTPGAEYYLDAWYVVMADIDIWNSMGFHSITPNQSNGFWSFSPLGAFTNGPAIVSWIENRPSDPLESHQLITVASETPSATYPANLPQGHVRVLGKAIEVAPGRWRYNYAVQNYDFDRNIDQVRIPLSGGAQIFDTYFHSPVVDGVQGGDWSMQRVGGELIFTAPPDNHLRWHSLFNFEVETDAVPAASNGTMMLSVAGAGTPATLDATIVAPGLTEAIFIDGFEAGL